MTDAWPTTVPWLGAYLNQDWDLDFRDDTDAMEAMLVSLEPDETRQFIDAARRLASSDLHDDEITRRVRRDSHIQYAWHRRGFTVRAWLTSLADQAEKHLERDPDDR